MKLQPQSYVAITGGSGQKIITRDAKPGHFASLVLGWPDGDATVYELSVDDGAVRLTVKRPGKLTEDLCTDLLPDA